MPTVLITGASRGLGCEFARQYAQDGWHVLAACRDPQRADGLRAAIAGTSGRVDLHTLDVEDPASIAALGATLRGQAIDLLINNAGVMERREAHRIGQLDYAQWERIFRINTIAPALVASAFTEHVAAGDGKLIVTLTSLLASMTVNGPGHPVPAGDLAMYRTSKAAANMVVRNLAADLRARGITAIAISPGHVRTAMGAPDAPFSPEESITRIRRMIASITPEQSGRFFNLDGRELPW